MKKIFYLSLMAAMVMSGCSKEDVAENNNNVNQSVLYASIVENGDEVSKSSLGSRLEIQQIQEGQASIKWSASDNFHDQFIAFTDKGKKVTYTLEGNVPTYDGKFTTTDKFEGKLDKAFFYYNDVLQGEFFTNNNLVIGLKSFFDENKNLQNAPMIGIIKGQNVAFSHLCAILKLDLSNLDLKAENLKTKNKYEVKVSAFNVGNKGEYGVKVAGPFTVKSNQENTKYWLAKKDVKENKVEIQIQRKKENRILYVVLPPVKCGLRFYLKDWNTNQFESTLFQELPIKQLEAGKMYTYTYQKPVQ